MRVSNSYTVLTSRVIAIDPNAPGLLLTLTGRAIIGPIKRDLWPDKRGHSLKCPD